MIEAAPSGGARAPVVLVVRPEPEASRLAAQLSGRGYAALAAPSTRRERRDRVGPEDLAGGPTLLLTSAAAARALGDDASAGAVSRQALAPLTALCVGDETARAAAAAGVGRVLSADGDAGDLAALAIAAAPARTPLLHLRGADLAQPLLPPLRAAGRVASEKILYAAAPADHLPEAAVAALAEGAVTAALLLSVRAARRFAELAPPAQRAGCAALCLSSRIAAAARETPCGAPNGYARVVHVERPRLDALIELLLDLYPPEGIGRESNR